MATAVHSPLAMTTPPTNLSRDTKAVRRRDDAPQPPSQKLGPLSEVLGLIPHHLHFIVRLGCQSMCALTLQNRSEHTIAFKIKTTRPKRYCVQPNVAKVSTGGFVNVEITIRAFQELPEDFHQCRDKFQILAVVLDEECLQDMSLKELWSEIPKDKMRQQKLKVTLEEGPTEDLPGLEKRSALLQAKHTSEPGETALAHSKKVLQKIAGNYYPLSTVKPLLTPTATATKETSPRSLDNDRKEIMSAAELPLQNLRSFTKTGGVREAAKMGFVSKIDEQVRQGDRAKSGEQKKNEAEHIKRREEEEGKEQETKSKGEIREIERSREEARDRVVHPAVAPVPPVVRPSPEEKRRVAEERAELLSRCLKERNERIAELKRRLAEETSRLSDARMAVAGAQDVKYEVDEGAKIPLAQIGLMAAIAIAALAMLT